MTLRNIAVMGADAFYKVSLFSRSLKSSLSLVTKKGYIRTALLKTINGNGGNVTKQDFENYKARIAKPIVGYYHGRKVVTTPLPSRCVVWIEYFILDMIINVL